MGEELIQPYHQYQSLTADEKLWRNLVGALHLPALQPLHCFSHQIFREGLGKLAIYSGVGCSLTHNLSIHFPADLFVHIAMATFLDYLGGNGVGAHWAGQGHVRVPSEAVEQLPSMTAQMTKDEDVMLVSYSLHHHSLRVLFRALAHSLASPPGTAMVNSCICWHSSSQVGIRSFWQLCAMRMAEHKEMHTVSSLG